MKNKDNIAEVPETKRKLVEAGVTLMRRQGFNATTVDNICSAAGVTKGGFFHYFNNKQELAETALNNFREQKVDEFAQALFRQLADPLDRIFGRLDYAIGSVDGSTGKTRGCLIGMFAQELAFTNPELRNACQSAFLSTAADFEKDLAEAKARHQPLVDFDPKKLALYYVSMVQGGLLLAKAGENNVILRDNIEQFRSHVQGLFGIMDSHQLPTSAGTSTSGTANS